MASSTRRRMQLAAHVGLSMLFTLGLAAVIGGLPATAQGPDRKSGDGPAKSEPPKKAKLGLITNDPRALPGYTLLSPMNNKNVYLLDNEGRAVHQWNLETKSHHCSYLLPNGHLLRPADLGGREKSFGGGPAPIPRVQEYTWDGELVWDFTLFSDKQCPHHDVCKMPNGNVLMIVWEKKTVEECIAAGRKPELVSKYVLPDSIIEVKPTGKDSGEIVWEWHLWDHLIQDHDPSKANYGVVADHPELVDINYVAEPPPPPGASKDAAKKGGADAAKAEPAKKKADTDALKTIGYVGTAAARSQRVNPDWTHVNSVDYNAELDQIMLSTPEFSEIWIIDHGTTTEEAAGHTGGRRGKGGDLLYRWGNPAVYRAGGKEDKKLFFQHNAHWIPKGLPGEGHVLVYNNGRGRSDGNYSSVDELVLPLGEDGLYTREVGKPYGPDGPVWSYSAPNKSDFFSSFISGAHRLPNGNTMICSGGNGTLFEVTPDKQIVWKYVNPAKGGIPTGGPPPPNQVLNPPLRDMLSLTPEQRKDLDAFQAEVDATIDKTLDAEQKAKLKERARGPGGFTLPGQIIATPTQIQLKLTSDQKKALADLQKSADEMLDKLLTDDQKAQLKQIKEDFARGGPPGGPGGPPGGPGGGPPGGQFGGGPPGGTQLFRAYKYAADYPGLAGRDLAPGQTVEEIEKAEAEPTDKDKDAAPK
jgi:hypothetical protein